MATVRSEYDEIKTYDADEAEEFLAEIIEALMDTETGFTAKGAAGMRKVSEHWKSKREHGKRMATDPAYRNMVLTEAAKLLGVEAPAPELAVLSTDADEDPDAELDADADEDELVNA